MTKTPGRVAVVNSAQTVLSSAWSDRQHIDLIGEAVSGALAGTGLRIEDVDVIIDSGSDFLDGRSISNCGFLGAMGAHHKEESRVEEDGLWALNYAADKIAGGSARVGLVIAYSKPSESEVRNYWTGLLEPFLQRPVGLDHLSAAALTAQRYLVSAGLKADDLRSVSERAWERALANPYVDLDEIPSDVSFWTEPVASPLTASDYARPVDGAVAVLLASQEVAQQVSARPVWLTGRGSAIDQHFFAARDANALPACAAAARTAFRSAGIDDAGSFDLAEVSATSTVGELMVLEALGLAGAGRGLEAYDGPVDINPSGGTLPADVIMASGLVRLHEAATRLAGRGDHASAATRALVHGTGGFAMQNHCVVTLEAAS